MKSRVSLYNVIPRIGETIHNFQNHDGKVWFNLQQIREMEKAVSQQNVRALSFAQESNFLSATDQNSNFVETSVKRPEDEIKIAKEEKMENEKYEGLYQVPSTSSDPEVEFSIADSVDQLERFRYSPTDEESSSSDGEFSGMLVIPMPENASKNINLKNPEKYRPDNWT